MNIKKYRADTTRGALEMIKQDIGDNALVLETRQVRTRGFLGWGSTKQIEVSAVSPPTVAAPDDRMSARSEFRSNKVLNLTEYAHAGPSVSGAPADNSRQDPIAALSEKAAISTGIDGRSSINPLGLEQAPIEFVELNPDEPRLVYPKKALANQIASAKNAAPELAVERSPLSGTNRDMEILRAEVREVKFALGAFANRQAPPAWVNEVDLDLFGKVFDAPFYDVYVTLTGTGISDEMARQIVTNFIRVHGNNNVEGADFARTALNLAISGLINFEPKPLLRHRPSVLAMIGATGVGKTTTVAKLAASVSLSEKGRVELVTVDTYRIAAVEQLKTYAEIIGAGCHVVRSVTQLDSVLRRLSPNATVLIDTTGRNPHDLADQYELSNYLLRHKEIRKCLAIQATTNPIDAAVAIKKFEMYGADCLAVTKMDETLRPGSLIQTVAESKLPLAYLCAGQRVPEDLEPATAKSLTNQVLGKQL